ncbi:hypothetical protein [Sinorhizobium americanum]|uniref:Uncharacterized protein n=1 Tax=Sinorhizobium americanum TaxID=194963 RepID=A0A4R2C4A2_9HYPH|nr:hypothetical protein [Sinorhizobium americanum]TCN33354.1 hypothetical protein EV184_103368 [Sinorhizobium americanum]
MGPRSLDRVGENGLQAACSHFPGRGAQVEELCGRDENFRVMCDDLAAAEEALAVVDQFSEEVRAARRLEYEELIAELAAEIGEALDRANIVPISRTPKH